MDEQQMPSGQQPTRLELPPTLRGEPDSAPSQFSDAICMVDAALRIWRCNHAMAGLLGRPIDEIVGQKCCGLVHGVRGPSSDCPIRRVWRTGQPQVAIRKRGGRRYRVCSEPLFDQQGRVSAVVHTISDVTERLEVEGTLRRRNRELTLLSQATHACNSTLDPAQVLYTILAEACHLLGVASSSVWLIDVERGGLVCQHTTGPNQEAMRGWRLPVGRGIVGQVAARGESIIVVDTRNDQRHYAEIDRQTGMEMRSLIGVPLQVKGKVIGAIELVDAAPDRFDSQDLRLLEPLAATAATAIENARLYERAQAEIAERMRVEAHLRAALSQIKTLSGLLPICASCKRIRDDQGYWHQVEVYIREHSEADFSHGLCPDCARRLYPTVFGDQEP